MTLKDDLANIFGSDSIFDDDETCSTYAYDQSFVAPCRPCAVVFVETVKQIQDIVSYANKTRIPLTPYSSGLNLHGGTIPREGGIIVNLSRMNRILMVDEDSWFAVIEPGVTFSQLQDELQQYHLRAMIPFGVPPQRSALTSYIEREPAIAAASFEYGNELIMDTEIVLPTGELFRTGLWSTGGKPGTPLGPVRSMLNRFWTGAQGTLGILTKMCVKIEYLPTVREIYFIAFDSLSDAIEPIKVMQKKEIGLECFLLNNFNMAAILCEDWHIAECYPVQPVYSRTFETLRSNLPPWTMLLCLSGGPRLPEEKIAYEREAFQEACALMNLQLYVPEGKEDLFLNELLRPWGIMKKFCYQGSVHDISFKSPLKRVPEFEKIISDTAGRYDYLKKDIGGYVLPIERGRAAHCAFDLHCGTENGERENLRRCWLEISSRLIDCGAFFDRPYGAWADMMYSRTGAYTQKLKELKRELDPNNIMNPGHLCF